MILAVDFDGTIVANRFPEIGEALFGAFESLRKMKANGYKLILWTCRENTKERRYLDEAVEFCLKNGLQFDAINDNLPESPFAHLGNSRKIHADRYIDDSALLPMWEAYFK